MDIIRCLKPPHQHLQKYMQFYQIVNSDTVHPKISFYNREFFNPGDFCNFT